MHPNRYGGRYKNLVWKGSNSGNRKCVYAAFFFIYSHSRCRRGYKGAVSAFKQVVHSRRCRRSQNPVTEIIDGQSTCGEFTLQSIKGYHESRFVLTASPS